MGKLIFELSDDERAMLERVRMLVGSRSHAEALRTMIQNYEGLIHAARRVPTYAVRETVRRSPVEGGAPISRPVVDDSSFRPHPKPGKAK